MDDRAPPLSFDDGGELRVLPPAQFRHTEELERAGADFAERAWYGAVPPFAGTHPDVARNKRKLAVASCADARDSIRPGRRTPRL